jgi:plastocyanin
MFLAFVFLILAGVLGGIYPSSISALQLPQNSSQNQSIIPINNTNAIAVADDNVTGTNTTFAITMNASIVPNAAVLEDMAYQPNPIQIEAGGTIIWTNNDLTTHTVTEGSSSTTTTTPSDGFDSGLLDPDQTFTHTFNKSGTVEYHCILHPAMVGKIIIS